MSELTRIADDAMRKSGRGIKSVEPYSTEEMSSVIEHINMGFGTVLQWLKELSVFVDFEAEEFIKELQDTINELSTHY